MFGTKYLTHPETLTHWNTGVPFAEGIVELRFAGDGYRFIGLSAEQQDLIQKIYPYSWETPAEGPVGLTEVSVFYRGKSEFRDIELKGWQYDLDILYSEAMVQIAGLGFVAKITWTPRLRGFLWTSEQGEGAFHGVFENFLRILIAYRLLERGGVMLHSAAFTMNTMVPLFIGRSGHGKSTVSAMALNAGKRVLSDDLNAVVIDGDSLWVLWVPFYGDVASPFQGPQGYSLQAFYLLEKSDRNAVSSEPKAQMLAHLISCSPYVNLDPYRYGRLMESLGWMCSRTGCYRLEFRKEGGFLERLTGGPSPEQGIIRSGSEDTSYVC